MRVVLDTNVLIDGVSEELSASGQLLQALDEGTLTAVRTPAVAREYQRLTRRLVTDAAALARIDSVIADMEGVTPADAAAVVIDDPEDRKFIEAALGGEAEAVVTSDRHLLDVGEVGAVEILTPQEAWARLSSQDSSGSEWQQWVRGLGVGY